MSGKPKSVSSEKVRALIAMQQHAIAKNADKTTGEVGRFDAIPSSPNAYGEQQQLSDFNDVAVQLFQNLGLDPGASPDIFDRALSILSGFTLNSGGRPSDVVGQGALSAQLDAALASLGPVGDHQAITAYESLFVLSRNSTFAPSAEQAGTTAAGLKSLARSLVETADQIGEGRIVAHPSRIDAQGSPLRGIANGDGNRAFGIRDVVQKYASWLDDVNRMNVTQPMIDRFAKLPSEDKLAVAKYFIFNASLGQRAHVAARNLLGTALNAALTGADKQALKDYAKSLTGDKFALLSDQDARDVTSML